MVLPSDLDEETIRLVQEAMASGVSKEEFREYIEYKKSERAARGE